MPTTSWACGADPGFHGHAHEDVGMAPGGLLVGNLEKTGAYGSFNGIALSPLDLDWIRGSIPWDRARPSGARGCWRPAASRIILVGPLTVRPLNGNGQGVPRAAVGRITRGETPP
jgi:hypothetical protein